MEPRDSPFDWNQARAFIATAETGSFSAAARQLNLTQPTLGRQVAGLEAALNQQLFERIGRRLHLTPAGQDILAEMRQMQAAADRAALVATGRAQTIAGPVCISVTSLMAYHVMPGIVADLRALAPQLRITIVSSNDLSDLQRREADIAVRHVAPTAPELIARKLKEAQGRLYASKTYLARHGPIETPEDTRYASFISVADQAEMLGFLQNWGLPITLDNLAITETTGLGAWEMARRGLGLMTMSDDIAAYFPEMQLVLPDLPPVPVPYWLTTHRELHSSRRIRLVYDHLAKVLSRDRLPFGPEAAAPHPQPPR